MPERLDQRTTPPAEKVDISSERISAQTFLHLQSQTPHTATHIGMARCNPDPHAGRDRNHPRNAASTRRKAARFTSLPTRTCRPSPSSISIKPDGSRTGGAEEAARMVDVGSGVSDIVTGMNSGISGATRTPSRAWRRQVKTKLSQTLWRAATAPIRAPGSRVSATMRSLSIVLHRRRRSRPVITSITPSIATP
jgi:hypothetical protein